MHFQMILRGMDRCTVPNEVCTENPGLGYGFRTNPPFRRVIPYEHIQSKILFLQMSSLEGTHLGCEPCEQEPGTVDQCTSPPKPQHRTLVTNPANLQSRHSNSQNRPMNLKPVTPHQYSRTILSNSDYQTDSLQTFLPLETTPPFPPSPLTRRLILN